ncbi:MAG: hypothetical protein E7481_03495 [Ruminococcaceae bacterium]|nr:hypothetical protein [Oscillospiraceae bacterium]
MLNNSFCKLLMISMIVILFSALIGCDTNSNSLNDDEDGLNSDEVIKVEDPEIIKLHDTLLGNRNVSERLIFYKDYQVTLKNISNDDLKYLVLWLNQDSLYKEIGSSAPYYDYQDIQNDAIELFGPDVVIDKESWRPGGCIYVYDELNDRFEGSPVDPNLFDPIYAAKFSSYEQDGEYIYIYNKILRTFADYFAEIVYVYSSFDESNSEIICSMEREKYKDGEITIDSKYFEEYGVNYKHIFKQSEAGSYYWVSSEPVT